MWKVQHLRASLHPRSHYIYILPGGVTPPTWESPNWLLEPLDESPWFEFVAPTPNANTGAAPSLPVEVVRSGSDEATLPILVFQGSTARLQANANCSGVIYVSFYCGSPNPRGAP